MSKVGSSLSMKRTSVLSCSQYRRHGELCTGVCHVNHNEVYGKGSRTNAFVRIRPNCLFTTLAVKTKKGITRLS